MLDNNFFIYWVHTENADKSIFQTYYYITVDKPKIRGNKLYGINDYNIFLGLHDYNVPDINDDCLNNVIDNDQCVDSCSKSQAPNNNNVCKPCIDSLMIYKLDGNCISQCPAGYESKDLYGEKNICSLIISNLDCSSFECENGICNQEFGSFVCKCKDGFYGEKCNYDQSAFNTMKESFNTNIESINNINLLNPLAEEQLIEIYNVSNLIKSVSELATDKLNESIASVVYKQIQYMTAGIIPFQNYTFTIADYSVGINNAL